MSRRRTAASVQQLLHSQPDRNFFCGSSSSRSNMRSSSNKCMQRNAHPTVQKQTKGKSSGETYVCIIELLASKIDRNKHGDITHDSTHRKKKTNNCISITLNKHKGESIVYKQLLQKQQQHLTTANSSSEQQQQQIATTNSSSRSSSKYSHRATPATAQKQHHPQQLSTQNNRGSSNGRSTRNFSLVCVVCLSLFAFVSPVNTCFSLTTGSKETKAAVFSKQNGSKGSATEEGGSKGDSNRQSKRRHPKLSIPAVEG